MTDRLIPISGCGVKGPACFLVETGTARLLLDLGHGPQPGLKPDVSNVGRVDALLLSHSHPDHAGSLELLPQIGNPPVYATDIVRGLLTAEPDMRSLPLNGATQVCGVRVTSGRNGHAPGGVWLHVDAAGGLLYMGDNSVESAVYGYDPPPAADTVILDASYGAYDRALEDTFPDFDRVFDAGPVLMPVPAAGRGTEIALHVAKRGRGLPHIDSAIRAALQSLLGSARACVREEATTELETIAREAPSIERSEGVMLAARGDADGGESAKLVARWEHEATPAIVFTGYLPPGTPAERLTRSGRAQYMRWNVHPRLSDNARLVRDTGARTAVPAFGERQHHAAWSAAFAPARVALEGPITL